MKKYFNFNLYKESLRQQRLIGWMSFLILALESFIVPVGYVMVGSFTNREIVNENTIGIHPLMLGLFVVAPMMVMSQFGFLNHRKACDFYHAIPHRRLTMFISMMAAVLTWCVFLIVSGYGMGFLCRWMMSGMIQFRCAWTQLLKFVVTLLAGCFYMAGLAGLAMSLTGTPFTNTLAFFLIGLAPRIIISIISGITVDSLPFLVADADNILTNWGYNIPFGWISYLFTGTRAAQLWMSWASIAFTTAAGLVYMVLGGWAFHCRNSESAGRSAVSPLMQTVFRMVLPLGISLPVTTALVIEHCAGYGTGSDVLFIYLTLYVIAVVAYLLYELTTTKQWRAVGRSMPGLLVLLALNIATVLGVNGWYNYQTGFLPSAGEIKKVEYLEQSSATTFLEEHMVGMELTDRALCNEIAAEITAQTQAWLKGANYYYEYDNSGEEMRDYTDWCVFKVTDHKGRTWVRKIWMSHAQFEQLAECVRQDAEVQRVLKDISGATYMNFYADWANASIDETSGGEQLYAILQQEIQDMDFARWYSLLTNSYENEDGLSIRVHLNFGTDYSTDYSRNLYVSLPAEMFPATYQAFVGMVTEGASLRQEELMKVLRDPAWALSYVDMSIYYMEGGRTKDENYYYYEGEYDLPAMRQHLIDCLTPAMNSTAENACILRLTVEMYSADSSEDMAAGTIIRGKDPADNAIIEEYYGESAIFFLTKEQYKELFSKSFRLETTLQ
ncbi:MAG: hypothetical protein IJY28_02545 [Clostridia bacterium]|nr:hypothetical protein [Clostridia bacterium]